VPLPTSCRLLPNYSSSHCPTDTSTTCASNFGSSPKRSRRPHVQKTTFSDDRQQESAKTIRKTVIRVVKPLNKVPNFRMFDSHATSLLFAWQSRTRAWHFSGLGPPLVRNPRHPGGNHPRRTLASLRRGSGAPQTRRLTPSSPPLAN